MVFVPAHFILVLHCKKKLIKNVKKKKKTIIANKITSVLIKGIILQIQHLIPINFKQD